MRIWVWPVLAVLVGLMAFGYVHDGPPYFETDDLRSPEWHHEKIITLLALTAFMAVVLGSDALGRRERVFFLVSIAAMMAVIVARANAVL